MSKSKTADIKTISLKKGPFFIEVKAGEVKAKPAKKKAAKPKKK